MTRKSKARYNLNRTYKVSQTVKALRRALALGLATAAVAPAAQAGICIQVINDVQCLGDFGNTTLDSGTFGELRVYDTFDPATVEMDGSIYTSNFNAINVWNDADLTFNNDGFVIVNDDFFSGNRVGIYAESFQGDVNFDNTGVIAVVRDSSNYNGYGIATRIDAAHDITVTNSGAIATENDRGFAAGLQARSFNSGIISITNDLDGDIGAEANGYNDAVALGVYGGGTVNITNDGDIGAASYNDSAFGIRVNSGDITITASSTSEINVRAQDQAFGIDVYNFGSDTVDISNAGLIETDSSFNATGIRVDQNGYGDVTVGNSGLIDTYSTNNFSAGIDITSNSGDVSVSNSSYGTIQTEARYAYGLNIYGAYNNSITVSNYGEIAVDGGTNAVGIDVQGDGITVDITNTGDITANGGDRFNIGIRVDALYDGLTSYGSITVSNTGGRIEAGKYSGSSYNAAIGIETFANGDITVTNSGSDALGYGSIVAVSDDSGRATGISAYSENGNISISNTGGKYAGVVAASGFITAPYGSNEAVAIDADAREGYITIGNDGIVLAQNANYGDAVGIRADAYGGGGPILNAAYSSPGDITVTNSGTVYAISNFGDAYGIETYSQNGDTSITNTGGANKYQGFIAAGSENYQATGIDASTGYSDGTITVSNTGIIYAVGETGATGINANSYSGDITITNASNAYGSSGIIALTNNGSAYGVDAYSDYGNISVTNSSYVVAESAYGSAFGISAETGNYSDGTITVTNTGYVIAEGYGSSFGVNANSDAGAITISNNTDANGYGGVISAVVNNIGYAYGIYANLGDSYSGADITITNGYGALITATANFGDEEADSYGIKAYHNGYGDILVTNAGTIRAQSYDDAQAVWAYADGDGDISITNTATGKLYAESADDEAYGVYAYANGDGNITVSNAGTINASTSGDYGDAFGIFASTNNEGDITVTNTSSIVGSSTGYSSDAHGIYAYSDDGSDIVISNGQYGSILAETSGSNSFAVGIEVVNDDYGSVSITNNGTVTVGTTGDNSNANGIWTHGGGYDHQADVTIINNGSFITSTFGNGSDAWGIEVEEILGEATVSVTNNGDITVAASYGDAFGIQTGTYGFETYTNITNNGDLTVSTGGNGQAIGIDAYAENAGYGDITVTNTASGYVDVSSAYGSATGIDVYARMSGNLNDGAEISITNAGDILVQGYGSATGIKVAVDEGSNYVSPQGYVCGAALGCAGINGYVPQYGFVVTQAGYNTQGTGGMDVTVNNSGSIDVTSDYSVAEGVLVDMAQGDYLASVYNSGDITVSGDDSAFGINVRNNSYGDIYVGNSFAATIDVSANKYSQGIQANADLGNINVYNEGSITSAASKYAGGIDTSTQASSTIRNSGDIEVTADNDGSQYAGFADAQGISSYAKVNSFVSNVGDITASSNTDGGSFSNAGGIRSASDSVTGWSGVYSDGDIVVTATSQYGSAYAEGIFSAANTAWATTGTGSTLRVTATGEDSTRAMGIWTYANDGSSSVYNEGLLSVSASSTGYGDANATGIRATANDLGNVSVTNEGVVTVTATAANINYVSRAFGIEADSNYGDITINNKATGTLTVTAQDYAAGIHAFADYGDISVTNAAAVTVNATDTNGDAYGVYAESGYGSVFVTNSAAITVTAGDYAVGIYAYANDADATVSNVAAGHVSVTGDSATGISVQSDNNYSFGFSHDATLNNAGKITVVGNDGDAYGAYVETDGYGTLTIISSGDITATSSGFNTSAYGLYAQHEGYGSVNITSSSKITVTNNSDYGDAVGIKVYSDGGTVSVNNSGTILASTNNGSGFSAGIYTENFGGYSTTISNSGSVKATGNNAYAIYHNGTDVEITNASNGKIFGVVYTDYGNDTFTNNGKWYATEGVNDVSDFQGGDDSIVNSSTGKIYMEDSLIDMGTASQYGSNSFLNNGKVYVNGYYNTIAMGTPTSVFTNNGTSLHFEDGAADDHLTIIGDFAGTGHIVVDAEGTSMLADRLYIEGNVVSNTANVIDVYLDQNPSLDDVLAGELIDIVHVTGTSAAANFSLGIVDVDTDTLYTLDYELVKQINYSGTNDLFSLGFEVSGLTPSGVAMSSIAPTVQNLWHLGVGTVFQREGTKRDFKSGGSSNSLMNAGFKNATGGNAQVADYQGAAGLWLRAFTEDGGLNPEGNRGNFGTGGAQSFDMKNSGIEFGAGYAFNSQWTAGLLGGVSDGSLKPTIGGRTSIDAKTIGGYVTYTPGNGFYADLSYRSMDFDGDGNGGGQDFSFDGKADGYSLEMGYGFKTSSGLIVEPQFQYSSMDVDLDNVTYNQGGFDLTDGKSSQTRLGVSLRKTMDMGGGNSWAPYASLSYVNESNASNDYIIGGVLTGNVDTSGNSTLLEGGATVKYGNMLFSGGLNWKDGGAYESVFGGQVSVRFTW